MPSTAARRRRHHRTRWEKISESLRLDGSAGQVVKWVGVGLALVALFATFRLLQARRDLNRAKLSLEAARKQVTAKQTDQAHRSLENAERALIAARDHSTGLPMGAINAIPFIGSPGRAAAATAKAGFKVVTAGDLLADAAADFPTTSGKTGVQSHDLTAIHAAAVRSVTALQEADDALHQAHQIMAGPRGALLPFVSGTVRPVDKVLTDTITQLEAGRRGINLLADLTSPTTDARILLLSQDTLELRPTGGFIGSLGIIHFSHGTVALEDFRTYEDLPVPRTVVQPPADLAHWLPNAYEISNTNWWPSFPYSAASARDMYLNQTGVQVDGVIGITENVMSSLIGVFGPITVPGYAQPVVENGFENRVVYEVELKRPLDTPRKKFLQLLSDQVFERVFSLPANQLPDVAKVFSHAAAAGDAQVWFPDPTRQAAVEGTSWAGELPTTNGDFLMLADANMKAGKANKDLTKDITYRVTKEKGQLVAHLEVQYHNAGPPSEINQYYGGFLRIYVPKGSVLLNRSDAFSGVIEDTEPGQLPFDRSDEGAAPDAPYDVFSATVTVDPLATRKLEFVYQLPKSVAPGGNYRLDWLRQAGTASDTMTAVIDGRPVAGKVTDRLLTLDHHVGRTGLLGWLTDHTPL